jgi:antirestriction protein ArdC
VTPENVDASPSSWFYANSITRTETDAKGEETEREIPYMKGYTVFNAAQCDGLPAHYTAKAEPPGHTTVITEPSMEKRPRTKNRGRR